MTPIPDDQDARTEKRDPSVDRYLASVLTRVEQLAARADGIQRWDVELLITEIDRHVGALLDDILHHQDFKRLEASWQGLDYAVKHIDFSENTKIYWLDCSKSQLQDDLLSESDATSSALYRVVHSSDYGLFGGQPFGALFVTFPFDHSADDVKVLRKIAAVGAAVHAPVFVDADPGLLRIDDFAEVPHMTSITEVFQDGAHEAWNELRDAPEARYLGVLLPRVQLRLPHRNAGKPSRILASDPNGRIKKDEKGNFVWIRTKPFVYRETIGARRDLLWGSPAYPLAVLFAAHFAKFRTTEDLFTSLDVPPPVVDSFPELGPKFIKQPTDVLIAHETVVTLAKVGLTTLEFDRWSSALQFNIGVSLYNPPIRALSEGGELATFEAWLASMFAYIRIASRFVHYLKVMERERIGANVGRQDIERELNDWIRQYVNSTGRLSPARRRKYPLAYALVQTFDTDQEGWYRLEAKLRPHARIFGQLFELSAAWSSSSPVRSAA